MPRRALRRDGAAYGLRAALPRDLRLLATDEPVELVNLRLSATALREPARFRQACASMPARSRARAARAWSPSRAASRASKRASCRAPRSEQGRVAGPAIIEIRHHHRRPARRTARAAGAGCIAHRDGGDRCLKPPVRWAIPSPSRSSRARSTRSSTRWPTRWSASRARRSSRT